MLNIILDLWFYLPEYCDLNILVSQYIEYIIDKPSIICNGIVGDGIYIRIIIIIIIIINGSYFRYYDLKKTIALSPIFYMVFFKFGKTPKNIPAQIIIGLYSTILIIKEMRI